jgi:hypothetical protein
MVSRESQYAPDYELHAVSRYDRKVLEVRASNKEPLFLSSTVRIDPTSHGPADPVQSIHFNWIGHSLIHYTHPLFYFCRHYADHNQTVAQCHLPFFHMRSMFPLLFGSALPTKARTSRD